MPLLPGDFLRIGYEDEIGHRTMPVRRAVPKGGRVDIPSLKGSVPRPGMKVFLIDRREPELMGELRRLDKELTSLPAGQVVEASDFEPTPLVRAKPTKTMHLTLDRIPTRGKSSDSSGLWLDRRIVESIPTPLARRTWWWLPPVIWPDEEAQWAETLAMAMDKGAETVVCNAPWQLGLLKKHPVQLVAGPFCNLSNAQAMQTCADMGFTAAFVSPELSGDEFLRLPAESPLPLGIVLKGMWPLGISRVLGEGVKTGEEYSSPKGEICWVKPLGQNYWVYPNWELDLTREAKPLEKAGYAFMLTMHERLPKHVRQSNRTSRFNWDLRLL